jgi:hypothetical protein
LDTSLSSTREGTSLESFRPKGFDAPNIDAHDNIGCFLIGHGAVGMNSYNRITVHETWAPTCPVPKP